MSNSTRWLTGIGIALALLVIITAGLAMATRNRPIKEYPENTAEGVTQRYLQAIAARDLDKAYSYLGPNLQSQCSLDTWKQQNSYGPNQMDNASASLRRVDHPTADQANVQVTFTQIHMDQPFLFGPNESTWETFFALKRQDTDIWRFSEFPWPGAYCADRVKPAPVPSVQ